MLADITPVILTWNEAPNLGRTLDALRWAREVVVVDSFSTDTTPDIAAGFPNVRLVRRAFDCHANQWNYAICETGIATPWTLALDADYVLTPGIVEEIGRLEPDGDVSGYRSRFLYCVFGVPLRGSAYPPVVTLFRTGRALYEQDGHTQRLRIAGRIRDLAQPILHDDRKPFSRWLESQRRYTELEAAKLASARAADLPVQDRLRKCIVLAPPVMLFYCLFVKGNVLDGRRGLYYAFQRTIAETMLSIRLLRRMLHRA